METALKLWTVIFAVGALNYLSRLSFIALFAKVEMPPLVARALRFVPAAMLMLKVRTRDEAPVSPRNSRTALRLLVVPRPFADRRDADIARRLHRQRVPEQRGLAAARRRHFEGGFPAFGKGRAVEGRQLREGRCRIAHARASTMRYTWATQVTFSLSRLRSVPLIVPRTLCGCQPVSSVSCSIVPPAGVRSTSINCDCLEAVGGAGTAGAGLRALLVWGPRFAALRAAGFAVRRGVVRVDFVVMAFPG